MKKTLLIAAAALAAGVISTQAQVYSQNIVGYVNQPLDGGKYVQITIPLQATSTNAPEDVFPNLQTGDAILLWNKATQQYGTYTFFSAGQWLYPDQTTIAAAPNLPPGTGLFFLSGNNVTNTYTGTVVLSNTNAPIQLSGGLYSLVGSVAPLGYSSLEDTNLNLPLQAGDAVLIWDQTAQQYGTYTYFSAGQWLYPDQATLAASPALKVGQGFFYLPGNNVTWSQNVKVQ